MTQKFVFEMRFVPDPSFLDTKGTLTKKLINKNFQKWIVADNTVQMTGTNGNVFISYSNLGFTTSKIEEVDIYVQEIDEVLKFYGDIPPLRWGVRIQKLFPSDKDFLKLLKKYSEVFLKFQPSHFSKINGELADLAINYVFRNEHNTYHIQSGPMENNQAENIFEASIEDLPDTGFFIDLDIYREKDQFYKDDFRRSRITDFIRSSMNDGNSIIEELQGVIDDN